MLEEGGDNDGGGAIVVVVAVKDGLERLGGGGRGVGLGVRFCEGGRARESGRIGIECLGWIVLESFLGLWWRV